MNYPCSSKKEERINGLSISRAKGFIPCGLEPEGPVSGEALGMRFPLQCILAAFLSPGSGWVGGLFMAGRHTE